jgi:hypothetical protein
MLPPLLLKFHLGAGNRGAILPDELKELSWVSADFRLGDVLLFRSLTIHGALENKHSDCMRLSVDFRYQCEGEALTEGCLKPHFNRISWDKIYENWKSKDFQFYWEQKNFEIVPWDESLHEIPQGRSEKPGELNKAYNLVRASRYANKK